MKKFIKLILSTSVLLINFTTTFGQKPSNKIIFLTDLYTTYIEKAKEGNRNVDSLYKEIIQTSIYQNYFLKSEYNFIVKDFFAGTIKNTSELKKSIDLIALNQETIKGKITGALNKCNQTIAYENLTIYIIPANYDRKMIIEGMKGIMGLTAGSKQIILTIEPSVSGWENMLEYAVAHEFNHAYWTNENFGKSTKWTLLDYLVFEGRGDYFAHLAYPNVIAPWAVALTDNQKLDLWNKIKPKLQSEDISYHMEVMFGSGNFPIWGGYSLGYDIVLTALKTNKKLTAKDWINFGSDKILEQSRYK